MICIKNLFLRKTHLVSSVAEKIERLFLNISVTQKKFISVTFYKVIFSMDIYHVLDENVMMKLGLQSGRISPRQGIVSGSPGQRA